MGTKNGIQNHEGKQRDKADQIQNRDEAGAYKPSFTFLQLQSKEHLFSLLLCDNALLERLHNGRHSKLLDAFVHVGNEAGLGLLEFPLKCAIRKGRMSLFSDFDSLAVALVCSAPILAFRVVAADGVPDRHI